MRGAAGARERGAPRTTPPPRPSPPRRYNALGSIDANTGDELLGWDTDQFPMDVKQCFQTMLIVMEQGGLAPGGLNFDAKASAGVPSASSGGAFSTPFECNPPCAGAPRVDGPRRHVHRPHRRHGHVRARAQGRGQGEWGVEGVGGGVGVTCCGETIPPVPVPRQAKADGVLDSWIAKRYSTFDEGFGAKVEVRERAAGVERRACGAVHAPRRHTLPQEGKASFADCEAFVHAHGEAPRKSGQQEKYEQLINDRYV